MTEEFCLSDKIEHSWDSIPCHTTCKYHHGFHIYHENDVKEFIKRLKKQIKNHEFTFWVIHKSKSCIPIEIIEETIDKLAGEKLC